jgi:hypothetical protein
MVALRCRQDISDIGAVEEVGACWPNIRSIVVKDAPAKEDKGRIAVDAASNATKK